MVFCYSDEENARIYAVHLTTANQSTSCLCASLLTQSGRGEKQASGKTHDVGVGREKQARKPTLEAYCWVAGRKVGVERKWQAEKPTMWA